MADLCTSIAEGVRLRCTQTGEHEYHVNGTTMWNDAGEDPVARMLVDVIREHGETFTEQERADVIRALQFARGGFSDHAYNVRCNVLLDRLQRKEKASLAQLVNETDNLGLYD